MEKSIYINQAKLITGTVDPIELDRISAILEKFKYCPDSVLIPLINWEKSANDFFNCTLNIQNKTPNEVSIYPYQEDLLNRLQNNQNIMVNHGRQVGVTTTLYTYALWKCLTNNEFNCVFITDYNSIYSTRKSLLDLHFGFVDFIPIIQHLDKLKIKFSNKSSIKFVPVDENLQHKFIGESIDLLIIDNAAFIPKNTFKDIWYSLIPIVYNKQMCISSVPTHKGSMFYDLWEKHNEFSKIEIPWYLNPNLDHDWVNNIIKKIGNDSFDNEFCCQFRG